MATAKPDLTRVWANGAPPANVVDPDTTTPGKVNAGWQAEVPPFEHFNFLQKWFTQGLAHFNEQGIAIWDTDTTYPISGLSKGSDGEIYKAVLEQSGNNPISDDGTNWIPFDNITLSPDLLGKGRSVFERLSDTYNLKDFGGTVDGSTDDLAAWNRVIDLYKQSPKPIVIDGWSLVSGPIVYQTQGNTVGLLIIGPGQNEGGIIGNFNGDAVVDIDGSSLEAGKFQFGGGFKKLDIIPNTGKSISNGIRTVGWWSPHHEDLQVGGSTNERFTADGIYVPLRNDIDSNPDFYASVLWTLDRVVVDNCLGYGVNGDNNQGYAGWTHNNCRYERNAKSGLGVHCAAHKTKGGSFSFNGEYGIEYAGEPGVTITGGEFEFPELDGNGLGSVYISRVSSGLFESPRNISRVLNEFGYPINRSPDHFVFDPLQACSAITVNAPYHRSESAVTYDVVAYATEGGVSNSGNISGLNVSGINLLNGGSGQLDVFTNTELLNASRFKNTFSLKDGKNLNSSFNQFAHSSASSQAITNTLSIIKFDLSVRPTGWTDYNTTTGELVVPYEGFYMFDVYLTLENIGSGDRVRLFIYKNGAVEKQYYWDWKVGAEPDRETISIGDLLPLEEGDVVDIRMDSISGTVTQFATGVLTVKAI